MATIGTLINHFFTYRLVGKDQFGNKYFIKKKSDDNNFFKRSIIYNGAPDASKIPPMWHAWLHYNLDEIPAKQDNYKWQKNHKPNLTGTKFAYSPCNLDKKAKNTFYKSWKPNKGEIK